MIYCHNCDISLFMKLTFISWLWLFISEFWNLSLFFLFFTLSHNLDFLSHNFHLCHNYDFCQYLWLFPNFISFILLLWLEIMTCYAIVMIAQSMVFILCGRNGLLYIVVYLFVFIRNLKKMNGDLRSRLKVLFRTVQ